jgi:hypothetical protein
MLSEGFIGKLFEQISQLLKRFRPAALIFEFFEYPIQERLLFLRRQPGDLRNRFVESLSHDFLSTEIA